MYNRGRKVTLRRDRFKVTGSVGTQDNKEVADSLNKVINEHAAVRVNLLKRDEGSWRSNPATASGGWSMRGASRAPGPTARTTR